MLYHNTSDGTSAYKYPSHASQYRSSPQSIANLSNAHNSSYGPLTKMPFPLLLTLASAILTTTAADSSCTTTIGLPGGCCPPHGSSTSIVLIDCSGCSLTSVTTGVHCDLVCPFSPFPERETSSDRPDLPDTLPSSSGNNDGDILPPLSTGHRNSLGQFYGSYNKQLAEVYEDHYIYDFGAVDRDQSQTYDYL